MGEAAPALDPGSLVLGRYRPLRPLGTGGSGSVWLARDERHGLDVALKIVSREGKAGQRAEREARAAARLRHPRCLRAYALARDGDHVYVAYEYVPGRTLRDALRRGELSDAQAIEACAQILDGLAHAHAHGIVHRDVKPANVLLAEADDEVSVRILDFGLAQLSDGETLTATGDVPGTLAYIPPERLGGDEATAAADVWAVGVILWEALAGRHPFWGSSVMETAKLIQEGAPDLAAPRPDLPRPLLALVERALEHDPARRPGAQELAHALRTSGRPRRRTPQRGARVALPRALPALPPPLAARLVPAALGAAFAGWTSAALPFFPGGFPAGLALAAAVLAAWRPRAGLALALAAPVLPLGNVSLALAGVYAAGALAWLGLFWRDPRGGLAVALGPLLAPAAALGLLPLALARMASAPRRAAVAAVGVLLAAVAAGIRGAPLPFTGEAPPLGLGVAGSERPLAVARALVDALAAHPALGVEAVVLAIAAALLPLARGRGLWPVAALGAGVLVGTLLLAPAAHALPLVVTTWVTCGALGAVEVRRQAKGGH